jgi:serine/threonine-protein kinase
MADVLDRLCAALADRYAIERELGSGGMATVYLAEDLKHHRKVAVKVLRPELAATLGADRFHREIEIAANLNHPHVLPLLDSGDADGFLYYVMPFVEGQSLRDKLAQEGELPIGEAVRILRDVVDALSEAHEKDFGVAKAVSEATGRQQLTTAGVALGTPVYMAPEQAAAESHIDHRADIYAVGVLAYELLTGRPPFTGATSQEILSAHVTRAPEPVTDYRDTVPQPLAQVVMKCLEKKPADRWQSAEELLQYLERLMTPTEGITATERRPIPGLRTRWGRIAVGAALLAAAVIAGMWMVRPGAGAPATGPVTPLTRDPGIENHPDISPDGSTVVYAAGPEGQERIYIRRTTGGRSILLSEGIPDRHLRPRWSPGGSDEIAFEAGGSVYVVGAFGGDPRLLKEDAESPAWSADGQSLAYVQSGAIYVGRVEGTEVKRLTEPHRGFIRPHSLAWSPDGLWIAYALGGETRIGDIGPGSIWVIRPDGTGPPVQVTGAEHFNVSPRWYGDGSRLLFISDRDGTRDLYYVPLEPSGEPASEPIRLTSGMEMHAIAVSADGTSLAYAVSSFRSNVWTLPISSDVPTSISTAQQLTFGNTATEGFAASPDGKWVAFASNQSGNLDIYKMPSNGGEPQRLTVHTSDDFLPDWSPDGREIAFYSTRMGSRDIFVMSSDGGTVQRVTDDPEEEFQPDWSPDGKSLVFTSGRTAGFDIYAVTRDTASNWAVSRQITFDGASRGPSWSPDGREIAYFSGCTIRSVPAAGGDPRTIFDIAAHMVAASAYCASSSWFWFWPEWSSDGGKLYFWVPRPPPIGDLWSVSAMGGSPRLVARLDDLTKLPDPYFALSPGEDRIYFSAREAESDIWLMELSPN